MKKIIILISICFLTLSCSENEEQLQPQVISKDKMIEIWLDIHLTEAKIKSLNLENDSARKVFNIYEQKIFEKHQINDSIYMKSVNYYMENLEEMNEIYDAISDSLKTMEKNLSPSNP